MFADDNADMREYVSRLLRERWSVEAVSEGAEALAAAQRRRPDLVLTDVMMPQLDGFGLLRALRLLPELGSCPRRPSGPADRAAPRPESEPGIAPVGDFECPPVLAGLRVLVVDDEQDTRELLRFVIGQCEAEVSTAASAAEALSLLAERAFDVLISDVGMPVDDGYALLRKVRALPPERGGAGARAPTA